MTCIVAGLVVALSTAACSGSSTAAPPPRPALETYAVGMLTDTFVDTSRPTAAWGPNPARPSRTLVTTVWYPATGRPGASPKVGAAPDRQSAPYPLIVFGHGLGATPQTLREAAGELGGRRVRGGGTPLPPLERQDAGRP